MNVSLTAELEKFVNERVASGMYHSASEVVREGLRLLREKDMIQQIKLQELRREIQKGLDDVSDGSVVTYDTESLNELAAEVKGEGRKRLKV
jgi:antitoxin ParD1/3/4